jgi:hypothetical protein
VFSETDISPGQVDLTMVVNLSKPGWSWGIISAIDCEGRTIWIADAHRDDGKRFIVRVDEILTAFVELESATRALRPLCLTSE